MGQTTLPEEILAYDGGDWEAKHRTSARVKDERIEAGLEPPVTMQPGSPGMMAMPPADMPEPEDEGDDSDEEDDDPGEDMDPTEPPID